MLKFFDRSDLAAEHSADLSEVLEQLKASGVAEDKQVLAQSLLEMSLKSDPGLDAQATRKRIAAYISNPDFLLFVAGAATLFGNASYVSQYAGQAQRSSNATDATLNMIHAAIFASFTLEKMVDIGKSTFSATATLSRRDSLREMARFMKDNYPLMAGGWLTANQVASGSAFAAAATVHGSQKEAVTAAMRVMATGASLGMTLYKYHSLLEKEQKTGETLIDPRIRRMIEPVDRLLGDKVRAMGDRFPYLAAAMLTGPHISIFYNKLTDKEKPTTSWASLSTILGYSAFVAYLASKSDGTVPQTDPQEQVEKEASQLIALREAFASTVRSVASRPSGTPLTLAGLRDMCRETLHLQEQDALRVARGSIQRLSANPSAYDVAEALSSSLAELKVATLKQQLPKTVALDTQIADELKAQLHESLIAGVASQRESLGATAVAVETPLLSRRDFLSFGRNRA